MIGRAGQGRTGIICWSVGVKLVYYIAVEYSLWSTVE